jgi:hypothetical protein
MSEQPVLFAVPTHLTTREPFVFGRSLDEFAKLVAVACVALKLAFADALPLPLRLALAALVILVGIAWALLRVQRNSLENWLGLAFRFGASPRRRVWRPTSNGSATNRTRQLRPSNMVQAGRAWSTSACAGPSGVRRRAGRLHQRSCSCPTSRSERRHRGNSRFHSRDHF